MEDFASLLNRLLNIGEELRFEHRDLDLEIPILLNTPQTPPPFKESKYPSSVSQNHQIGKAHPATPYLTQNNKTNPWFHGTGR